ncbi:MAG: ATP-binding protein [Cyclobacteriaceae bacterium]|nr:ATP-binding protein [Cyclobacteriaceae bacterium]MCH8516470.1 ATP-binding protein [Cyclobacteriaceae bacterium]
MIKTTKDLDRLIKQGESSYCDFKKTANNLEKIAKTLVAFANSEGGYVLIGVTDKGGKVNIDPEEQKFQLEKANELHIEPKVEMQYYIIREALDQHGIEELLTLVVHVQQSKLADHYFVGKSGNRKYYYREQDHIKSSSQANNPYINRLKTQDALQKDNNIDVSKIYDAFSEMGFLSEKQLFSVLQKSKVEDPNKLISTLLANGYIIAEKHDNILYYRLIDPN